MADNFPHPNNSELPSLSSFAPLRLCVNLLLLDPRAIKNHPRLTSHGSCEMKWLGDQLSSKAVHGFCGGTAFFCSIREGDLAPALSEFRRQNPEALKNLFVQIGWVARELGHVKLEALVFDGTRLRANSGDSTISAHPGL